MTTRRRFVPDDRTVVALDTNVLRQLCHESPKWLPTLREMAGVGYAFCFADLVVPEVAAAVVRGSISRKSLAKGIERAQGFVFEGLPFLPGPHELNIMTGAIGETPADDLFETRAHLAAVWRLYAEPSATSIDYTYGGKTSTLVFPDEAPERVLSDSRTDWQHHFAALKSDVGDVMQDPSVLKRWQLDIDREEVVEGPPLSRRLDLQSAYLQELYRRHGASLSGYHPESKRSRNDGLDFGLLFALLIPALIVTDDRHFVRALRRTSSYQSGWVLTPEELVQHWHAGHSWDLSWR